jgi:hypothetical protein
LKRSLITKKTNKEQPNIDLAVRLCETRDLQGLKEIAAGLSDKREQVANDCIKVLYETGERSPELIADFVMDFIQLLRSKNNRLVWGGMTALSQIAALKPEEIFDHLDTVVNAYQNGSVITRDNSISVFALLAKADKKYAEKVFPIIISHLSTCRDKEVGQHAERAFVCVDRSNAQKFVSVLRSRVAGLTDAQQKRVEKLIRKIQSEKIPE